jgi:hypothetical protein
VHHLLVAIMLCASMVLQPRTPLACFVPSVIRIGENTMEFKNYGGKNNEVLFIISREKELKQFAHKPLW